MNRVRREAYEFMMAYEAITLIRSLSQLSVNIRSITLARRMSIHSRAELRSRPPIQPLTNESTMIDLAQGD